MRFSRYLLTIITTALVLTVYQVNTYSAEESKFKDAFLYDDLSMGGQFVFLEGDRTTKFEEYREVATGPQSPSEILMIGRPKESRYIYFEGFDMFRSDQSEYLEWGKPGESKASFKFNEIPHRYSENSRLIEQKSSDGVYTVDSATRATLAGLGTDALRAAQINAILPTFDEKDLDIERNQYEWKASSWINDKFQTNLNILYETREGFRRKGTGTYIRTGDTFEARGIELPEPIDYRTLDVGARLTYAVPNNVTSLEWALSYFNNQIDTIIWDNPFSITDNVATGGGGANRGNFNRGRLALYPDNLANTITLSEALTLPYKTNLNGSVSYSVNLQDDRFLPYTTNTALNGNAAGEAGFSVTDTSHLPKDSLNGIVHIFSANVNVINRAIDRLKVKAYMNLNDYINSTRPIEFPGYAAFGDSYWLTTITTNVPGDPINTHPPSFLHLKSGLKLDYELTKKISVNTGFEHVYQQLKNRQVPDIDEFIIKNGIEAKPWPIVKLDGSYLVAFRRYRGEYYTHREYSELRQFDQSDRNRQQVDARMEITPNDKLTLGASGTWRRDAYRGSYGLHNTMDWNASLDSDYAPNDKWSVYTYYSFDHGIFNITSLAKSGTPYDTSNTWFSDTSTITNTFGAGTKYSFIPDRLILDLGYSFSLASEKISNYSLQTNPANPITASSYEWPAVHSDWHELKAQLKFKVHKNFDIKAYYTAELYHLNDFAWDNLHPYMAGQTVDNTTQYLWIDSRYKDYIAHVFGFTLKYVF